jgi:hypothetical protein
MMQLLEENSLQLIRNFVFGGVNARLRQQPTKVGILGLQP